jgi:hypothetical protein
MTIYTPGQSSKGKEKETRLIYWATLGEGQGSPFSPAKLGTP